MLDHTYSFHFKVVPDKINDMLDHACIYVCLPACCVCMSEISVLDAHPEQKWILAHSLNGLEEVGTDFLVSLATEQHAALHVCKRNITTCTAYTCYYAYSHSVYELLTTHK